MRGHRPRTRPGPGAGRLGQAAQPRSGWTDLPATVTATSGTAPNGRRVHVVHNWSWLPAHVKSPVHLTDALGGASIPAGATLNLGAWDVRVFFTG